MVLGREKKLQEHYCNQAIKKEKKKHEMKTTFFEYMWQGNSI